MSDIILSSPLYSSVPSIPIKFPVIRVAFILYQPILVSSYSKVQSGNVVTLILYSSGFVNLLPTVKYKRSAGFRRRDFHFIQNFLTRLEFYFSNKSRITLIQCYPLAFFFVFSQLFYYFCNFK